MNQNISKKNHIVQKRIKAICEDDLMSPTSDLVFKVMFQSEEKKEYTSLLISTILELDREEVLKNMKFYKTDFDKSDIKEISQRGDLVVRLYDTLISVEMNNQNELERNVEYTHRLYSASRVVGHHNLQNFVLQINVNNFTFKNIHNTIEISQTLNQSKELRVKIIYIDVYLPLIKQKYESLGLDSLNDKERIVLALFISKKSKAIELGKGDEMIMKYIDDLENLTVDKSLWRAYDHQASEVEAGFASGREEGLEQGIEQGHQNIIKNMLKLGLPIEKIHELTNIPIEEINNTLSLIS